jgi:hypothetical protein
VVNPPQRGKRVWLPAPRQTWSLALLRCSHMHLISFEARLAASAPQEGSRPRVGAVRALHPLLT